LLSNQLGFSKKEDKIEFLRLVYAFHSETRPYLEPLLNPFRESLRDFSSLSTK